MAVVGCSESATKPDAPAGGTGATVDTCDDELQELQRREAEITQMIQNLSCLVSSSCQSIAFGTKPCGGPWRYLVYSRANVNEGKLKELVSEYNALEAMRNSHCTASPDCPTVTKPKVSCPVLTMQCAAN